jgi:uncharacterized protein (TIGR02594 family)
MLMADLITALPWLCLLLVFVGMAALQWRVINALDQALARMATPPAPVPVVRPVPTAPPPTPAQPAPAPKPSGPFPGAPDWFQLALHEIGFHETGNNQGIDRYISMAHAGTAGDPWCAIFANAMLEQSGVPGTRSASSQSFRTDPNFVQLANPTLGCIVVFWRISKASGQGHVGFYRGEDSTRVWTLGGNENDMVQIEALPKDGATFGLIGYWWPKSGPLPAGDPVLMPAGSPAQVQTAPSTATPAPSGVQSNITATVFGGQKSAYGPPIDDNKPGVALPFRFTGDRPRVRVSRSGQSVDCDIVDIGPWNINDPYWTTGARPQAESGTDMGQTSSGPRHTNKAGIDLTAAAAKAIGIDGKGLCDWSFVETAAVAASPTVI